VHLVLQFVKDYRQEGATLCQEGVQPYWNPYTITTYLSPSSNDELLFNYLQLFPIFKTRTHLTFITHTAGMYIQPSSNSHQKKNLGIKQQHLTINYQMLVDFEEIFIKCQQECHLSPGDLI